MKYKRASRKQLAYLEILAGKVGKPLPWGWEGYSAEKANKLITSLKRQSQSTDQPDVKPQQPSLF